jgi:hypothetical protein
MYQIDPSLEDLAQGNTPAKKKRRVTFQQKASKSHSSFKSKPTTEIV